MSRQGASVKIPAAALAGFDGEVGRPQLVGDQVDHAGLALDLSADAEERRGFGEDAEPLGSREPLLIFVVVGGQVVGGGGDERAACPAAGGARPSSCKNGSRSRRGQYSTSSVGRRA